MKRKYIFVTSILLILLCIFLVWKVINHYKNSSITSSKNQIKSLPKEVTISLDKNGFTPAQATITVGSAVRWINNSGKQQTVNSDNYPTNQLHRELNFGVFNNGSSVVYTFTKPGVYGFHNQFHHEQAGKITVTQ